MQQSIPATALSDTGLPSDERRAQELDRYYTPSNNLVLRLTDRDSALPAHMQFLCWRLGMRRALVSLINRDTQYSLSLFDEGGGVVFLDTAPKCSGRKPSGHSLYPREHGPKRDSSRLAADSAQLSRTPSDEEGNRKDSLIDTTESCAHTLLDTIQMVLDYSKVNAFTKHLPGKRLNVRPHVVKGGIEPLHVKERDATPKHLRIW